MNLILFFLTTLIGIQSFAQGDTPKVQDKDLLNTKKLIELDIEGVYEYESEDSYLVRLIEADNDENWTMTMVVGGCEAIAVSRSIYKYEFSRPLTYDLFNALFESSSLKLKHIAITRLFDGTYYAKLVIDDNGKDLFIDARPSDCINIAMKSGASVYATQSLWEAEKEQMD